MSGGFEPSDPICSAESGSFFFANRSPYEIVCSVDDSLGQSASCRFQISVEDCVTPPPPPVPPSPLFSNINPPNTNIIANAIIDEVITPGQHNISIQIYD